MKHVGRINGVVLGRVEVLYIIDTNFDAWNLHENHHHSSSAGSNVSNSSSSVSERGIFFPSAKFLRVYKK